MNELRSVIGRKRGIETRFAVEKYLAFRKNKKMSMCLCDDELTNLKPEHY
jgi:hypothetical protein